MRDGFEIKDVTWIRGTCYKAAANPDENKFIQLPAYDIIKEQEGLCGGFAAQFKNNDAISAKGLAEKYTDTVWVVQNPPQPPLNL